ncbi:MAG: nitroreductase family protein [Deltaproteobacteria bacterium]|nr:nitroreductase family protein [Deltaproteobacteria bacterium]
MEVMEAIRARRSVRRFLDRPVPREAVETLIEALRWAPSAGNLQSRFFYFVFDAAVRKRVAEASFGQMFISTAPLVAVVCADLHRVSRRYGQRGVELYAVQDAAVAVENMMLEALELGLSSVWVGAFDEAALSAALDLPGRLRPVAVVPIGYPAHSPAPPPRLERDDIVKIVG